jgi:hypothetical protein
MSISTPEILKIIEHFLPGDPLSYNLYDDGSLVVIADTGKKHTFSADQVASVHQFLNPKPKTVAAKPKTAAATAPKIKPAPSKTASKPKSTS